MSSNDETAPKPEGEPPFSSHNNASSPAEGSTPQAAECERLKAEVKRLEEERERDRQLIEALRKECQTHRQALSAWALAQVTPEELHRWATEEPEEGQELHEFIGELENIVNGKADA
jgi:chromosome condensin MukBEF ATPase and DNA-binding subunit MukB